jgi:hypothetical protein
MIKISPSKKETFKIPEEYYPSLSAALLNSDFSYQILPLFEKLYFKENFFESNFSDFFRAASYNFSSRPKFLSTILHLPRAASLLFTLYQKERLTPEETKQIRNNFLNIYFNEIFCPNDISSRKDVFHFLLQSGNLSQLVQKIKPLMDNFIPPKFDMDGDTLHFRSDLPVGIKNPGALCFLNSILQQLFGIYEVRQSLYSYSGNDKFLLALQKFFGQLQYSNLAYLETDKLALHWKNWDGSNLSKNIQQDASEFLLMVIDKLEPIIEKSFFQTSIKIQITSSQYGELSNNVEYFTLLPVSIAGSNRLESSLESHCTEEVLKNYEYDGKQFDAIRSQNFSEIPNQKI